MTPQRKPKEIIYVVWDTDPKYDEPVLAFKNKRKAEEVRDIKNHNNTTTADLLKGNLSKIFKVRRFTR